MDKRKDLILFLKKEIEKLTVFDREKKAKWSKISDAHARQERRFPSCNHSLTYESMYNRLQSKINKHQARKDAFNEVLQLLQKYES
tara:strand:- start:223 stop:480 length:258 start_codon:yes stop_codon:yes gene_type:complete